ncbi:MAG: peptidoglycan editing factor PgeF [Gammaproteobacteria bacterium]
MDPHESPFFLTPAWPAPARVRALSTRRSGGCSRSPYDSLNLAAHVGDDPLAVAANRRRLCQLAGLPAPPPWLQQVHGTAVVDVAQVVEDCIADGSFACSAGVVCAVLTADCLPVLLCERRGRSVAALHCGWRGLAAGIIEQALTVLAPMGGEFLAWLGPAIGPAAFVVGEEVRQAFVDHDPAAAANFAAGGAGRWHADLYALARQRLAACGVQQVYGGGRCTWREETEFFSYRRDGVTGRMATLIWIEEECP